MRALALAVSMATLAGCQTGADLSAAQRLAIACSSYASTLDKLADRNRLGLMSEGAQARVDEALAVIAPICEHETAIDAGNVLASVETSLIILIEEQSRGD